MRSGFLLKLKISLSDSLAYEALTYHYEEIKETSLKLRADILSETEKLTASKRAQTSSVLKTLLPEPLIGFERTNGDSGDESMIYLEAKYPFWGFNLGKVKEAKANKEKQEIHLEALKKQVSLEVYQSFLEAELADKQVIIQKKASDEANELLRQITLQYEEGEIQFLTYLENIKTVKETRLAYFNSLKDYKEKLAELERAIQFSPIPEGVKQS